MYPGSILPESVSTLADIDALDSAARRFHTTCGAGSMVWRRWGEGRPVVLLHGGSGSWNHWARNITSLVALGRQVWVPDLPGFGDSASPPSGGDADALPWPMEAALQTLLGDAAVDLVGFSFGTMVGALIARQWPQRVRRLVLSGAPALGVHPSEKIVLRPWSHLSPGPALDAAHRENLARLMLAQPESVDALALALHAINLPRDRMKLRRLSRTNILLDTLPTINCPVFGIWGREDVLYRGVQDQIAGALAVAPGFRTLTLIPNAGHWVQFERADAYNRALAIALKAE